MDPIDVHFEPVKRPLLVTVVCVFGFVHGAVAAFLAIAFFIAGIMPEYELDVGILPLLFGFDALLLFVLYIKLWSLRRWPLIALIILNLVYVSVIAIPEQMLLMLVWIAIHAFTLYRYRDILH